MGSAWLGAILAPSAARAAAKVAAITVFVTFSLLVVSSPDMETIPQPPKFPMALHHRVTVRAAAITIICAWS
jgi:hypothetical protein